MLKSVKFTCSCKIFPVQATRACQTSTLFMALNVPLKTIRITNSFKLASLLQKKQKQKQRKNKEKRNIIHRINLKLLKSFYVLSRASCVASFDSMSCENATILDQAWQSFPEINIRTHFYACTSHLLSLVYTSSHTVHHA